MDNFCNDEKGANNSFNSDSSGYTSLDEKEAKNRLLSMQSNANAGVHLPPVIKTEPIYDEGMGSGTEV